MARPPFVAGQRFGAGAWPDVYERGPLRMGNFLLDISIEETGPARSLSPSLGGGDVPKAQINPDFQLRGNGLRGLLLRWGGQSHQSPTESCAKQPHFHVGSLKKLALKRPGKAFA